MNPPMLRLTIVIGRTTVRPVIARKALSKDFCENFHIIPESMAMRIFTR